MLHLGPWVVVVVVENFRRMGTPGSPGNQEVSRRRVLMAYRRRSPMVVLLFLPILVAHLLRKQNLLGWMEVHGLLLLVVHRRTPSKGYVSPRAHENHYRRQAHLCFENLQRLGCVQH